MLRCTICATAGLVAGAALLLVPVAASPQPSGAGLPAAEVKAEGNIFTGGLRFNPDTTSVRVGQKVRWTNTDNTVPHTATENHRLWDLTGNYGLGQESNTGFGPGESRERVFEAGTHHYFCKVHPQQMRAVVNVPVDVTRGRLRGRPRRRFRRVTVTWAAGPPDEGLAFDLERRRVGRAAKRSNWRPWKTGTTSPSARMRVRRGRRWQFRARLRKANDPSAATDWSPATSIRG
jgi:plastocyanin